MGESKASSRATGLKIERRARPDHFSTYVPRSLVRRLKVVATIRDVPLWAVVTEALEDHLETFQKQYGRLPTMDDGAASEGGR